MRDLILVPCYNQLPGYTNVQSFVNFLTRTFGVDPAIYPVRDWVPRAEFNRVARNYAGSLFLRLMIWECLKGEIHPTPQELETIERTVSEADQVRNCGAPGQVLLQNPANSEELQAALETVENDRMVDSLLSGWENCKGKVFELTPESQLLIDCGLATRYAEGVKVLNLPRKWARLRLSQKLGGKSNGLL